MSRERVRQDQEFWTIVKGLNWKLQDHDAGRMPPPEPEFGYGGGRGGDGSPVPSWATHVLAFLAGGIAFGLALVFPVVLPLAGAAAGLLALARRLRR